ncbi:CpsD/CapB family tyrosine-protein kinase [Lysinibacillus sp. KU-BSD001]|uniref:CpsD/CapB family tyrosine-protein kinase n=1 Tax=Lysinibacillus sp. KU-BSD001 TaxID=3141328 RepID=UPI0036E0F068
MLGLRKRAKKKANKLPTMARKLITVSDPKSILSEQFRTIRTNITFALPDQQLKTILITSSTAGEGKSTNASNIATVFAQEGKKVLIVDADMRKPTLHYIFGLFNTVGLSTVLARKSTLYDTIQETSIVGLSLLPSGPIPPNPTELLSSKTMDAILEEIKEVYDIIIFDAPPLLPVSDAQILSNKCDGTLLIVHSGVVEKDTVLKAKTILTTSQAKILGVVLNNYKMPRNRKNYYQYYGASE